MTTVLDSLNTALKRTFARDERVYLLGEDVLDPYGGAFKVTQGLSTAYPDRVISTPISEAGIVGVASGMALRGLLPVVEIMFGDFLTLAVDQVINHLVKFSWMYNDQVSVPVVIRTPMGGRRGYGPTHSQTLEKLFLGVPGLRVLAPSTAGDPGQLLEHAILHDRMPVLFIENKLLYLSPMLKEISSSDFLVSPSSNGADGSYAEPYTLTIQGAPDAGLTIAAYGYMAELARQAALKLAYEMEIFVELVIPTQLAPFQVNAILDSTTRTGRLLVVEEGTLSSGWGAEVVARIIESAGGKQISARRLGAMELPVPASGVLEEAVLPGIDDIIQIAVEMV